MRAVSKRACSWPCVPHRVNRMRRASLLAAQGAARGRRQSNRLFVPPKNERIERPMPRAQEGKEHEESDDDSDWTEVRRRPCCPPLRFLLLALICTAL